MKSYSFYYCKIIFVFVSKGGGFEEISLKLYVHLPLTIVYLTVSTFFLPSCLSHYVYSHLDLFVNVMYIIINT